MEVKMNGKKAAEQIKEISGTNPLKCMKCGKCSATCPSYNEMDIKPHQFVSYGFNETGKLNDAARQLVVRQKGGNYLLADEIPELLDPELPQQLLVSALRRYRR